MAIPVWPASLPFAQAVQGATDTPSYSAPQTAETEGGRTITRPRPGPRITERAWRRKFSEAEHAFFETFARTTLMDGTRVFDMKVYKAGSGYVTRKCQIKGGVYSVDYSKRLYPVVSMTLLVFDL